MFTHFFLLPLNGQEWLGLKRLRTICFLRSQGRIISSFRLVSLNFRSPLLLPLFLLVLKPGSAVTMLQTVREAGADPVRKGPILLGKGRAFPRSSPASVLLSKSQKMSSSGSRGQASPLTSSHQHFPSQHPSLPLSPSKQSPGSHSESSPSPTSKVMTQALLGSQFNQGTMSTTSGALTLTPSTTSSSLTSVTTPNSLTPGSSTAKSITPTTTLSNYSLTSELSATLVSPAGILTESPTTVSGNDIFTTISVRSRVSAFEVTPSPSAQPQQQSPSQVTLWEESRHVKQSVHVQSSPYSTRLDQTTTKEIQERQTKAVTQPREEEKFVNGQQARDRGEEATHTKAQPKQEPTKAQPIPPSPFPIRRFSGPGPGHVERRYSIEERERRRLPSLPQDQSPHPLVHQYSLPAALPPKPTSETYEKSHSLEEKGTNGHNGNFGSPPSVHKQAPPPPPKPKSKSGSADSVSGGSVSSVSSPPQSNSNGSASSSPSWATTVASAPLKSVSSVENSGQVQSPGTPAKITSPSPASTPPPVPPRLERRPSQPSPTSSPPAMPPPVPPRLGRAAPVRTPSLDSK